MQKKGHLTVEEFEKIKKEKAFDLTRPALQVEAPHFANYVSSEIGIENKNKVHIYTTLDGPLQIFVQNALENRLKTLDEFDVKNGAVFVLDNENRAVLAWAVHGDEKTKDFDSVLVPRQTGSTLKPFVYGMALEEKKITAATRISDTPHMKKVGSGLHKYRNYSNTFYGWVSMREALGNSLNIPAVRTLEKIGVKPYMHFLRKELGVKGLGEKASFYGEGLALGTTEISLFKMTALYAGLAQGGKHFKPTVFLDKKVKHKNAFFSQETSDLLANILSDPHARAKEFGRYSVLNFNPPVAVKTGTSNDYHDAWIFAFDRKYTVGIWMGNLSRQSTNGLTGGKGPALLARTIFTELRKKTDQKGGLTITHKLKKAPICTEGNEVRIADKNCANYTEYFISGTEPKKNTSKKEKGITKSHFEKPVDGLQIAMDKRVPKLYQAFEFKIKSDEKKDGITFKWILNGKNIATTKHPVYTWKLEKGKHLLRCEVLYKEKIVETLSEIMFIVK